MAFDGTSGQFKAYQESLGVLMGGYQNYGPLLGPLNIRCRIIIGPKKGP